jgi:protein-S-isoprenylcysteine O-methyltransferase Ste14
MDMPLHYSTAALFFPAARRARQRRRLRRQSYFFALDLLSCFHRILQEEPMGEKEARHERPARAVALVVTLLAVTGASFLWRLPRDWGAKALPAAYLVSFFLLLAAALAVFRRVAPRAYRLHGRMTLLSFFLQMLVWGIYFSFPCLYQPYDWAWTSPGAGAPLPALISWACVGLGLAGLLFSMAWLGWRRSSGQGSGRLERSGPYRLSRNPQLAAGALLVAGYAALRPSWYALGWLVLYAVMTWAMVRAEEEYLRALHGPAYDEYCRRVPRYAGLPRRP